jgi:hypothetical protein
LLTLDVEHLDAGTLYPQRSHSLDSNWGFGVYKVEFEINALPSPLIQNSSEILRNSILRVNIPWSLVRILKFTSKSLMFVRRKTPSRTLPHQVEGLVSIEIVSNISED